jgi:hypothetical protein
VVRQSGAVNTVVAQSRNRAATERLRETFCQHSFLASAHPNSSRCSDRRNLARRIRGPSPLQGWEWADRANADHSASMVV